MTFLEQLQAHKGGLVQLKTELYCYAQGRYDGNPGRVCLILDVAAYAAYNAHSYAATATAAATVARAHSYAASASASCAAYSAASYAAYARAYACGAARAYLLIDGGPQWIWIAETDAELL
jgi:hypothetical protein